MAKNFQESYNYNDFVIKNKKGLSFPELKNGSNFLVNLSLL